MNRHLTNDELLNRLYGVSEAERKTDLHLRECAGCAERWRAFELRRAEMAQESDRSSCASNEFLASQRRAIYARLEQSAGGMHVRWAPAVAAGFLLAAGMYLVFPGRHAVPQAPVVHVEMSDEQLFSDVYSMEQSAEPRAAVPIHALFAAAEGEEQQ